VASAAGLRVAVVNWLLSDPPERVNGYFIGSKAIGWQGRPPEPATLRAACFPPSASHIVAAAAASVQRERAGGPYHELRDAMATRVASSLLAGDPELDFVAVYLRSPDDAAHAWESEAQRPGPGRDARWEQLEASYRLIDELVGELASARGSTWTILVVADHGWNFEPTGPGHHGFPTPSGVFLYGGPSPPLPAARGLSVRTLDVAPTVLALLGVPLEDSLPGRVLLSDRPPTRVATYHIGPAARPVELSGIDSAEDAALLERLRALGYID
jgi:hypothetical protein